MQEEASIWKLRKACLQGDTQKMENIFRENPELVIQENPDGLESGYLSILYQVQFYAYKGDLQKVKDLIEGEPALLNQPWSHEAWTPLHQATPHRSLEIFQYFITKRADVHLCAKAEGVGGYSVLHAAAWEGNIEAARILLEHGVELNIQNADGVTPLEIAKNRNNTDFADYLKSLGASG